MLVRIDKEADVIYTRWGKSKARVFSREIAPGIFLEEDGQGRIVGVEVLSATSRAATGALDYVQVEIFGGQGVKD